MLSEPACQVAAVGSPPKASNWTIGSPYDISDGDLQEFLCGSGVKEASKDVVQSGMTGRSRVGYKKALVALSTWEELLTKAHSPSTVVMHLPGSA